jgi:hypothetical protein
MADFTYDPELTTDEFWQYVRDKFNEWNDENRVDSRFTIVTNNYKVTFIAEGEEPSEMIMRITKR